MKGNRESKKSCASDLSSTNIFVDQPLLTTVQIKLRCDAKSYFMSCAVLPLKGCADYYILALNQMCWTFASIEYSLFVFSIQLYSCDGSK